MKLELIGFGQVVGMQARRVAQQPSILAIVLWIVVIVAGLLILLDGAFAWGIVPAILSLTGYDPQTPPSDRTYLRVSCVIIGIALVIVAVLGLLSTVGTI